MSDIDIFSVILQVAYMAMFGLFLGGVILLRSRIPWLNRPKYEVILKELTPEGRKRVVKETQGWLIKSKGITYFWVKMGGVPFFKGIKFDRDYIKTINEHKEVCLICSIPNSNDSTDYQPENIPITQKDRFVEDEKNSMKELLVRVLRNPSLFIRGKDDDGNETISINESVVEEGISYSEVRTKQNLTKHSRLVDLDSSKWLEDNIDSVDAQKRRAAGGDFLERMMPYFVLILIGLFAYLSYDSISKNWIKSAEQFEAVSNAQTAKIVEACGGQFYETNITKATQQQNNGLAIPFING